TQSLWHRRARRTAARERAPARCRVPAARRLRSSGRAARHGWWLLRSRIRLQAAALLLECAAARRNRICVAGGGAHRSRRARCAARSRDHRARRHPLRACPLAHLYHPCLFFSFTSIYSDLGLTRQLESQHGEGEKEGQEESCEEEVRPLLGGRFGGRRVIRFAIIVPAPAGTFVSGGRFSYDRIDGRYEEAARRRGRSAAHSLRLSADRKSTH